MKLTRREAVALVSAPAMAVQRQPETTAETPEQLLEAARQRLKRNFETLGKFNLPAGTEPAFQFRAQ